MALYTFKESFDVYSIVDKSVHNYFTECSIDLGKGDIMGTATLTAPFNNDDFKYWSPIRTGIVIRGGVFDYEDIFVGVVREVRNEGYSIVLTIQNVGRKFKEPMDNTFLENFVKDQPCVEVIKSIFDKLHIDYSMDLIGIPDYESYEYDENGSVVFNGETVSRVPDLVDTIKMIGDFKIDNKISKYNEVLTAEEQAKELEKKRVFDLYGEKEVYSSEMTESNIDYSQNYNVILSKDEIFYGDQTYEEIIQNFCSAVDAHWYVLGTKVYLLSYLAMFTRDKTITGAIVDAPRIEYWMQKDESFDLDINQYGMYNTVKIKYNNGVIKESYEDLVRVYGEVAIEYDESGIDKQTAELKAKAYLSAHVRDFDMSVKLKCLYSAKFGLCNFVRASNPLTLNEELYLITDISISFNAKDETWIGDMTLSYGPHNPDNPEVPEVGSDITGPGVASNDATGSPKTSYPSGWFTMIGISGATPNNNLDKSLAGKSIEKELLQISKSCGDARGVYNWVDNHIRYPHPAYAESIETPLQTVHSGDGNCGDQSNLVCTLLYSLGYEVKIVHIPGHYYPIANVGGQWMSIDTVRKKFDARKIVGSYPGTLGEKW